MTTDKTRAQNLLDKIYDRLEKVDVEKLSYDEMKDFLEVVQKGQFLEAFGTMPEYGFGGFNTSICDTRFDTAAKSEGTELGNNVE